MKKPIEIKLYKDCIPKKGIWYNHLGTIFISVMRKSKPYVRRKSIPFDNKKDNELSEWHRVWQYERIEGKYGVEKYGIKSYEITIKVNGETHRIDSVVKNIAIEFQHTLSVGIEEMDSRFNAHKKFGFIPYLVIDLTNYDLKFADFYLNLNSNNSKYKKWFKSDYAASNNLFIDLKDGMIRIVNSCKNCSFIIEKDFFINNLLNLEEQLKEKIKINELEIKREEIKEKIKKRHLKLIEAIRNEEELKRLEKENFSKEKILKKRIRTERDEYYHRKRNHEDFKYYRKCIKNSIINPYLLPYKNEIFEYHSISKTEGALIFKTHYYSSNDSRISIEYTTVTELIKIEIPTFRGSKTRKKYTFFYSIIKIKNSKTIIEFEWEKGKNVKKIDKNEYRLF